MPTSRHTERANQHVHGFTLVELMVVLVIVALLASLTLAGLAGTRDRAKADKTRSTIRKLHEIVIPQYESYLTRRVVISGGGLQPWVCTPSGTYSPAMGAEGFTLASGSLSVAVNRLWAQRLIMTLEMPDQWNDVGYDSSTIKMKRVPKWALTSSTRRYAMYKFQAKPSDTYESAECLAMMVMRGGFDPDAIEAFRNDEVGDRDKDGAAEFLDGWGSPIAFVRWPAGFNALFPATNPDLDPTINPDPFDPTLVATPQSAAVSPLLYSPGPDEALNSDSSTSGYGLVASAGALPDGWLNLLVSGTVDRTMVSLQQGTVFAGSVLGDGAAARDNITNFYLLKK